MYRHAYKVAALFLAMASICSLAYAAHNEINDARAVLTAKVPISQAIAAAEQSANGKASRAEYEWTRSGWAYDVEVVGVTKVYDVRVDADKGTILSSVEDKPDLDGRHEHKGDHDEDHDD
ncbi:MAG: PepSY domain-containing protein [Humidesulfovibrio sp.]|nr:PepSY domain-containing protein [Humidesulfovibrio sp.]